MPAKQEIINIITSLPEDMDFEDILRTLTIINSDKRAMEEIEASKVFTAKQVLKNQNKKGFSFSALQLQTKGIKFDREIANER